ncbi:hypothetical protein AB0E59_26630 [Lentzea sp. NPDC034063]|uniref:hypothetical protein n=1 Tax=unclassified Lentzea TaxID=2643253 RepID=UPI0033F7DDCE
MYDDPHHSDHSVRDGIFDGSADDIADLSHPDFADDDFPRSRRRSRRGYQDLSGAPSWVKVFVWVGTLLAIAGFGVVLFGLLGPSGAPERPSRLTPAFPTAVTFGDVPPDFADGQLPPGFPNQPMPPEFRSFETPGFPQRPTASSVGGPNLALGFGLFFAGFVVTAIGALGHSTSKRR